MRDVGILNWLEKHRVLPVQRSNFFPYPYSLSDSRTDECTIARIARDPGVCDRTHAFRGVINGIGNVPPARSIPIEKKIEIKQYSVPTPVRIPSQPYIRETPIRETPIRENSTREINNRNKEPRYRYDGIYKRLNKLAKRIRSGSSENVNIDLYNINESEASATKDLELLDMEEHIPRYASSRNRYEMGNIPLAPYKNWQEKVEENTPKSEESARPYAQRKLSNEKFEEQIEKEAEEITSKK